MKLYSTDGATAVDDPELGLFPADEHGAIDVPIELYERLHGVHIAGRKLWESEDERHDRLEAEELARRKDPATLLAAVESLQTERSLTAEELRAAEEERKRIAAEREAEIEQRGRILRLAAECGVRIGEIAHVPDFPAIEGVVTEIFESKIDDTIIVALETGDTRSLDELVGGPRPVSLADSEPIADSSVIIDESVPDTTPAAAEPPKAKPKSSSAKAGTKTAAASKSK